jgi:hypothetical protein
MEARGATGYIHTAQEDIGLKQTKMKKLYSTKFNWKTVIQRSAVLHQLMG